MHADEAASWDNLHERFEIKRLNAAYTYALRSLSVVDRHDPLAEMLARKIIDVGATESDPVKISEIAIKRLV